MLIDVARFLYGAVFLVGALATLNFTAAGNVASGMTALFFAAALEVCSIAFSIVGLATRLVASVLNFGYASFSNELFHTEFTLSVAGATLFVDSAINDEFKLVM